MAATVLRYLLAYTALEAFALGLGAREYCQSETFKATCWKNEVVVMESAYYGRMHLGRCVEADLGYIGCSTSVLHLADKWCSGKRSCEIGVPNSDLDNTQPCFKELKTFLETDYKCVRVATAQSTLCETSSYVKLVSTEGYLASITTDETGCGSADTPWIIQVDPGQRINVTLLDFTRFNVGVAPGQRYEIHGCRKYAGVRDRAIKKNVTVCAGDQRERHLYLSRSNSLEISILKTKEEPYNFLIKYETIGCADLSPPDSAYFKRTPTGGVIGCTNSESTWHLTCEGTQWVGVVGNCSNYAAEGGKEMFYGPGGLPYGVSIAIIIAIALLIGLVILGIGLLCFARRRHASPGHAQSEPYYQTAATSLPLEQKVSYTQKKCPIIDPRHPQSPGGAAAAAAAHAHTEHVISPGGATLRTIHCTNDYAHIWEAPLPDSPLGGVNISGTAGSGTIQETTYAAQCDCAFNGTLDTCGGQHTIRCFPVSSKDDPSGGTTLSRLKGGVTGPSRKAYIATKPVAQHGLSEDCYEGHRYFVIDRDNGVVATSTTAPTANSSVTPVTMLSGNTLDSNCNTGPDIIPLEVAS